MQGGIFLSRIAGFITFFLLSSQVIFSQPSNDTKSNAFLLNDLDNWCSANEAYTTVGAGADGGTGSCWPLSASNDVWFKFEATTNYAEVKLKTGGSEGTLKYPILTLWDSSGSEIGCAYYNSITSDIVVTASSLNPGDTYYVSADNYQGYAGTFTLCLSDYPTYDFKAGAYEISSLNDWCSGLEAFTTEGATPDQSSGSCWNTGPDYNRWFQFQPSTNTIEIELKTGGSEGTLQYPYLALWDSAGNQVACASYSDASSDIKIMSTNLDPDKQYYISVDNRNDTSYKGTFTLCATDDLDYDYKVAAKELTDLNNWCSSDSAYTTVGASPDESKGSCWSNGPNNNRWFKFKAKTSYIDVNVKTGIGEGSLQYPMVALWDASGQELACKDESGALSDIGLNYGNLVVGNWYYISVDNVQGQNNQGSFKLCINEKPNNDFKGGAYLLSDLANWTSELKAFSTKNGTPDRTKPTCWPDGPNNNKWFKFKANYFDVSVELKTGDTLGTIQSPRIALWDSSGNELACKDTSAFNDVTLNYSNLTKDEVYYISVDNAYPDTNAGSFTLNINNVNTTQFYAISNGDWGTSFNWSNSPGGAPSFNVPTQEHVVHIDGYSIQASSNQEAAKVNMSAGGDSTSLFVNGANLDISGNLKMKNDGNNAKSKVKVDSGHLKVGSNAIFKRKGGNKEFAVNVRNDGQLSVTKSMQWISEAGTTKSTLKGTDNVTIDVGKDLEIEFSGGDTIHHLIDQTAKLSVGNDLRFNVNDSNKAEVQFKNGANFKLAGDIVKKNPGYGKVRGKGQSTIVFNGSNRKQVIETKDQSEEDNLTFENLKIDNAYGGVPQVILKSKANIKNKLTLANGVVQSSDTSMFVIEDDATFDGANKNSYISGPVEKIGNDSTVFPIGDQNKYAPLAISAPSSQTASYTVQFNDSGYGDYTTSDELEDVCSSMYWELDRNQGTSPGDDVTVSLFWNENDFCGYDHIDSLKVGHFYDGEWKDEGAGNISGDSMSGYVTTSSKIGSFSPFTFSGEGGSSGALPVELKYFEGKVVERNQVKLDWATASEQNNSHFIIQRRSASGEWLNIGRKEGHGTKLTETRYQHFDEEPFEGINYYRLKQVDFNGKHEYSSIISIKFNNESKFELKPAYSADGNRAWLMIATEQASTVHLQISDLKGQVIKAREVALSKGSQKIRIPYWDQLNNGLYLLQAKTPYEGRQSVKMIKR